MLARAIPSFPTIRTIQVPAGNIENLDSSCRNFSKWIVDLESTDGLELSFQVIARVVNADIQYTRYSVIGEKNLKYNIIMSNVSNKIKFDLENNHSSLITARVKEI